ncbi:MAG TPA: hemagglutinin repeat-containing protein, partial [Spirochaetota bacterium]
VNVAPQSTNTTYNINVDGIDLSHYVNIGATGNAMFGVNTKPGFTYLIETRNEFVDVSKLKGSEYFLDRIGFHPDQDVKFLGDAYYEQKLVTEGILQATSERYLDDSITSDQEQMAWLIENAVSAYRDYHLAVGVALTKDQINQLQQPIVWYVEEKVMGVDVLAPRIYIPEHIVDGFSKTNAATISGKDVELHATDTIANYGGTIKGTDSVSLETDTGNIINETAVYTQTDLLGNKTSTLGTVASIESGGTLTIKAGNDFDNKGAQVTAGSDADISAGGNITFETVREVNKTADKTGYDETTKVTGSTLDVGGNLKLASAGDTTFIGSTANIAGKADIETGGNFNLINDYDTTYSEHTTESGSDFSSKTTHTVDSTKTVVGSAFTTGGDLTVKSANDINIVGSSISSNGNTTLDAAGTLNIVAVHDEEYHLKETTKSGFGAGGSLYGSEKKSDSVDDKNVFGSNVDVKEKYSSKSGNDTNITGSSITAGESADIETGGNLNIAAAYDEHSEDHSKQSGGMLSGGTSLYQKQIDMEGNRSTKAVGAQISAGNLTVTSEGDVLIEGSTITAGQANIDAKGSIIEKSAEETNESYSIHETTNVTAGDALK